MSQPPSCHSERSEESKVHGRKTRYPVPCLRFTRNDKEKRNNVKCQHYLDIQCPVYIVTKSENSVRTLYVGFTLGETL